METESGDAGEMDAIEEQAAIWVVRLTSGDADDDMLQAFERWKHEDARHEAAVADARRVWLDLGQPLQARYAPPLASLQDRGRMRASGRRSGARNSGTRTGRRSRWIAVAASTALVIGLGQTWATNWRYDQATMVGEQRTMALEDGSTLWLNTGSAANVEISDKRRHVDLARGEAFFDVRRDPDRPFIVDAGVGQIRVLGTAFGVQRDGDDVIVTVQRGRVEVSGGGTPPVVITPDQRVRIHSGDRIKRVEFVSADQALAWRNGRLVFEDRPLSEILDELKRYDRRMLLVQYSDVSKVRVNAMIDLARIDEWYDGLQQSLPLEVRRVGPVVWVRELDVTAPVPTRA